MNIFIEIFERMLGYINVFRSDGPVVRCWVGPLPMFFLFAVEAFEVWRLRLFFFLFFLTL